MGRTSALDNTGAGLLRAADGKGLDSMMVVGKPPWHYAQNEDMIKLLEGNAKVTSAEVNKVAGLDWNVYQTPAFIYVGGDVALDGDRAGNAMGNMITGFKIVGTQKKAGGAFEPDYFFNVRDDIHSVVGVVRQRYKLFQNSMAPIFLDSLVDSSEAFYETAGSLHAGSQVWWLMKLPKYVTIGGDDREKIETFILLTNSHDGSTKLVAAIVTIRVICQNTLTWALKGATRVIKIKHTAGAPAKVAEARRVLEIGYKYTDRLIEEADLLTDVSITDDEFQQFLDSLVPVPEPDMGLVNLPVKGGGRDRVWAAKNQRSITIAQNMQGQLRTIYFNNPTQQHIRGTLWGAVQAASFYSDHYSLTKTTNKANEDENRFKKLIAGNNLGHKAFKLAFEFA